MKEYPIRYAEMVHDNFELLLSYFGMADVKMCLLQSLSPHATCQSGWETYVPAVPPLNGNKAAKV